MQERAQQQIQRLRSLRSTPIHAGGPHAVRSGHSSVPERGFAKHRKSTNVPQQSAVVEPDRLPSKAELRGTLGTVSRKVCACVSQLYAVSHYPCMHALHMQHNMQCDALRPASLSMNPVPAQSVTLADESAAIHHALKS